MDVIEMFERIKTYHKKLGYNFDGYTSEEKMRSFRDFALALNQEVAEIVNSTPWKPWRAIEDQEYNICNVIREVIDCIFFLGGICEILNISPGEINEMFIAVEKNNYLRITEGYNNKEEDRGWY